MGVDRDVADPCRGDERGSMEIKPDMCVFRFLPCCFTHILIR